MTADKPEGPPPRFQFTIWQLMLLMTACSLALGISLYWGLVGFVLTYFGVCTAAAAWGWRTRSTNWLESGLVMLLLGVVSCFLFPTVDTYHTPSNRGQCGHHLKQIVLALQNYHEVYGSFPPAYVADARGKPLHSWRVLLLPFLEQQSLYREYRFDEPWDGPHNRKLHNFRIAIFECPGQNDNPARRETNYLAVTGPRTVWPGGNSTRRDADIIDGIDNTIVVVEVESSGIHWMEPRDLHVDQMPMIINAPRGQGISSHHHRGANVAFASGRVDFLSNDNSSKTIRAFLTASGKEPLELPNP